MRIIIIGNSGSGKSWLANRLAALNDIDVVHLDDVFWEPGGFSEKRSSDAVAKMIEKSRQKESWIVEGVFGEQAGHYCELADFLVWLDLDWSICRDRLLHRGSESGLHMGRAESTESLNSLIEWASGYHERTNARSHQGHKRLMDGFAGTKIHIRSENEVRDLISDWIPDSIPR